jgi:hypothetical protein
VIGASRATFFGLGCVILIAVNCSIASGRIKVRVARFALNIAVVLAALLLYSSFIAQFRTGNQNVDYAEYASENFETRSEAIDLIKKLPPLSQAAVLQGALYFSHSYKYLARCLEMNYVGSTYGFGFSPFLTRTYTKISGSSDLERRVYFQRLVLEDGDSPGIWVTGYAWLASDWTFPGSLIILFALGLFLAQSWREAIAGVSIAAVPVMCWTFFIVVMLPIDFALSEYGDIISFVVSIVTWRIVRRRYLYRKNGIIGRPGLQYESPLSGRAT